MEISTVWHNVWTSIMLFLLRLLIGLFVALVVWIAANAADRWARRLAAARRVDPGLTLLFGQLAKVCLLIFGGITALGTIGVDVSALVAGLGLTGFALGFALRDIIANALSGFFVIFYKPFKNGDRILVTALEGTVTDVNLRYTVLHAEGKKIFVPNASLMTNPITVTLPPDVIPGP
jgi:small-conductance mechanosensitive channel